MINLTTNLTTLDNDTTTSSSLTNQNTTVVVENLWTASVQPWGLSLTWTYDIPIVINTVQLTNL